MNHSRNDAFPRITGQHFVSFTIFMLLLGITLQLIEACSDAQAQTLTSYDEAFLKATGIGVPLRDPKNQSGPIWEECFLFVGSSKGMWFKLPDNHYWTPDRESRQARLHIISSRYSMSTKTFVDLMMDEVMPNGCRWKCNPANSIQCRGGGND